MDAVAPFVSKLRRASHNIEIGQTLDQYRSISLNARFVLTAIVVAWGLFLSRKYVKSTNKADINAWKDVNELWLGKDVNGILLLIFKVWIFTLLINTAFAVLHRFNAL